MIIPRPTYLNQFKCGRAFSSHIESKKSKLDYHLPAPLSDEEIKSLEAYINGIVKEDVEVTEEFLSQEEAMKRLDMSRLPENASEAPVIRTGCKELFSNWIEGICGVRKR